MTKIWLKLQLHFSQKTTTKTKLKSAVKINTGWNIICPKNPNMSSE